MLSRTLADMNAPYVAAHPMSPLCPFTMVVFSLLRSPFVQQLNMQPQVINEYESGKAIPNNAVIAKIERALGCKLPRAKK